MFLKIFSDCAVRFDARSRACLCGNYAGDGESTRYGMNVSTDHRRRKLTAQETRHPVYSCSPVLHRRLTPPPHASPPSAFSTCLWLSGGAAEECRVPKVVRSISFGFVLRFRAFSSPRRVSFLFFGLRFIPSIVSRRLEIISTESAYSAGVLIKLARLSIILLLTIGQSSLAAHKEPTSATPAIPRWTP